MTDVSQIEKDAAEFGVHIRQGGWRLGLLVARSVESAGHGGDRRSSNSRNLNGKVSATEFADRSATTAPRVLRYLKAWNAAASQMLVPCSADLQPGQDVDLDAERLPEWSSFYPQKEPNDRYDRAVITIRNRSAGEKAEVARELMSDPDVAGRVVQDPTARQSVMKAVDQHYEQAERQTAPRLDTARDAHTDAVALVMRLRTAHRALAEAVSLAQNIRGIGADDLRDGVRDEIRWIRMAVEAIEIGASGDSIDDQLAELLDSEAGR